MAAPEEVSAPVLLLLIVFPPFVGLTTDDGPRWYYVAQALLVAALLWMLRRDGDRVQLSVCWLGIGIQLLAAWFGFWSESGALDETSRLAVLAAVCLVAEIVARQESRTWHPNQQH